MGVWEKLAVERTAADEPEGAVGALAMQVFEKRGELAEIGNVL